MIKIIKCDWPKSYNCRKTLQNWLKMLFIAPLYNLEKYLLLKCICYKKSMKNCQTFPLKACPFLGDNRFLFNTEMSNIKSWNFQGSYLACCHFFMSWNFGDRKYISKIYFRFLFLAITERGGICILKAFIQFYRAYEI